MKNTIIVGMLLVAMLTGAYAELSVTPPEHGACCSTVAYNVKITNPDKVYQRVFALDAVSLDTDKISLSLEPKTIAIGPGGQEELLMIAKPDCDLLPGKYKIKVSYSCLRCGSISQVTEAVLTVTDECLVPKDEPTGIIPNSETSGPEQETSNEETEKQAQKEPNNAAKNETKRKSESPTAAVIASNEDEYKNLTIGTLLVVLGIFIILVARMERKATIMEKKLKNVERMLEGKK